MLSLASRDDHSQIFVVYGHSVESGAGGYVSEGMEDGIHPSSNQGAAEQHT